MQDYFYTLTARGELLCEGITIDDEQFRDIFFMHLRPNTTGQYPGYSYCSAWGSERYFLQCEDTPYVFTRFDSGKLYYSSHGFVQFDPEELVHNEGVLYHIAPHGQWGRIASAVAIKLVECFEAWGPWYSMRWQGRTVVIPPRDMPANIQLLRPRAGNYCIGCGRDNPASFDLTVLCRNEEGQAESWLVLPQHACGSTGRAHGGIVALLLDEIMGKVLSGRGVKAVTVELSVRYIKPVEIGLLLHLSAELVSARGRVYTLRGNIERNDNCALLAQAEGVFVVPRSNNEITT